ncbi:hypothetical protein NP233_g907 [Leucocoprinus birnbaumii]|uniref:DUF7770 domain-containing protein n=1 Tax=Leucocoprinus birnbaumii TaxID=56174 RepID=A0AAD5YWC8_9AGAR|nr:hypothetical protein NP233_g907 [Leucocoprinus birnbaumii]
MKFSIFSLILTISSSATLIAAAPLGFSNNTKISNQGVADLGDWRLAERAESNVYSREPTGWQLSGRDLALRQPKSKQPKTKDIDTKKWNTIDRGVKIERFVATAVKMPQSFDPENPTKQLIHWRGGGAYKISDEGRSTSLDTRKLSDDDPIVQVQFISKDFEVSSRAPYYWDARLIKDYTTNQVYDLLKRKKFNQYKYNGAGSGCLTWTTALVKLFEDEGIIAKGSKAAFEKKVEEVRNDPRYWVPEEPGAGFYQ